MTYRTKYYIFTVLGMVLCIVPAVIAVLRYFPLWLDSAQKRISVMSILLLAICVLPLWRQIKAALKSPSVWQVYLFAGLILFALDKVAGDIAMVFLIACPFSVGGALLFRLAKKAKRLAEVEDEERVRREVA